MKVEKANKTIDCTSLYCPMPIVKTAAAVKDMQAGEVLEVLADDPGIKEDMPAWCETTGNEFLGLQEEDGVYKTFVKKKV
jgi:TusA-related sulfurtransferase